MDGSPRSIPEDDPEPLAPVVLAVAPPGGMDVLDAPTFLGRMPNVGILYLASALEQAGYPCEALDRHYDACTPFQLAAEILSHEPCMVGFTLFDLTMEFTRATIEIIRQLYDGPIVVGGYTATFHAEDILGHLPEVDYVLTYEAESSLVKLLQHLDGEGELTDVPNLYWRDKGMVRRTGKAPLVDVTQMPWPKRYWDEVQDVTPIITRRGCTSACSFCAMVPFYERDQGPVVRYREVADVVDEIEDSMAQGRLEMMFYDDDFGLATKRDRAWADAFVEEVKRRNLRFQFGVELRVVDILRGESQLRALAEVGMSHMAIGMESLLPRQLELYKKGYRQAQVLAALEIADRVPIYYQTNVIFWDPFITLAEASEHLELLDSIGFQDQLASANYPFYASTLSARRGTSVHGRLTEQGILRPNERVFYRYEYDFQDPQTAQFHRLCLPDFLERSRRTIRRPPALWMLVPRLRFHGHAALADELERCGSRLTRTEFEYFQRYVALAREHGAADPMVAPLAELHEEMAPRLSACADEFPRLPPDILEQMGGQISLEMPEASAAQVP